MYAFEQPIKQLHEADFNDPSFDYVVEIKSREKVCFGTTLERDTDPIGKGQSPFQKSYGKERFTTGPGSYQYEKYTSSFYPVLNKIRSTKGVGGLASQDKRFKGKILRTPSPGRYELGFKKDVKPAFVPFNIKSKYQRPSSKVPQNNPGPSTYNLRNVKKCRRTRILHNFGHPSMVHTVETLCIPEPTDTCTKCQEICKGDYWQLDYLQFLCHPCYVEEKRLKEIFKPVKLKKFKRIRNCSFMHRHEGTNAAVITLEPRKIRKKFTLENYLDLFLDC